MALLDHWASGRLQLPFRWNPLMLSSNGTRDMQEDNMPMSHRPSARPAYLRGGGGRRQLLVAVLHDEAEVEGGAAHGPADGQALLAAPPRVLVDGLGQAAVEAAHLQAYRTLSTVFSHPSAVYSADLPLGRATPFGGSGWVQLGEKLRACSSRMRF